MTGWEEAPRTAGVDGRILEILSERSARIAFNGLRRALGVHPESLTRALRRLEREGAVTRTEGGYALRAPPTNSSNDPARQRTVASVKLPAGAQSDDIFGRLAGRWFGSLRWVGIYEHPGDPWLVWSTEDGAAHVMLAIRHGSLRVLTDRPTSDTGVEDGAAYELLSHALHGLRAVPRQSGASVLTLQATAPTTFGFAN